MFGFVTININIVNKQFLFYFVLNFAVFFLFCQLLQKLNHIFSDFVDICYVFCMRFNLLTFCFSIVEALCLKYMFKCVSTTKKDHCQL